jgi:CheY-like chemotaxis protein
MQDQSPGELPALAQRSVRILVVDDNAQEQQILKLKLEGLGASVILVRHGRMAIMTAQKTQPDIIILDLETTDMPGLEVLRHLKSVKRTSSIPVICISGSRGSRALRLNADWYLAKPFKFSEMLARLRYLAQELAAAAPAQAGRSYDELRKGMMRAAVDTLSDGQDIRKALHGLKGYIGADDYYLNSKLEICFRSLVRIESRLKEFRDLTTTRAPAAARITQFPHEAIAKDEASSATPESAGNGEPPDDSEDDRYDGTHGGRGRRD